MTQYVDITPVNTIYSKVTAEPHILGFLYDAFGVPVDGYWYMPSYRRGIWDGHIRFFRSNGTIYTGLVPEVVDKLNTEYDGDIVFNIDHILREDVLGQQPITREEFVYGIRGLDLTTMKPRKYQLRAAFAALQHRRGNIIHATGSGKSYLISLILSCLRRLHDVQNSIIIVPRIQLVEQFRQELIAAGFDSNDIGMFYGGIHQETRPILVSTWQSLNGRKNKWLKEKECVFVDEAHQVKAKVLRGVLESISAAKFRYGVTGTLPDVEADKYLILGLTGPIIDIEKTASLINEGYLSDVKVIVVNIKYSSNDSLNLKKIKKDAPGNKAYALEQKFIEEHPIRNKLIKKLIVPHCSRGENSLILVEKLDHGRKLMESLTEAGIECDFVHGAMPVSTREKIRLGMESSTGRVIVATYGVYQLGINIRKLHVILFAMAGKSKIRTLQSIGRGLRTHKSKKQVIIYDLADLLPYAQKRITARVEYYIQNDFDITNSEVTL